MPKLNSSLAHFISHHSTAQNEHEKSTLERFLEICADGGTGREILNGIGHITASAHIENREGTKVLLVFSAQEGRWKRPGSHIENDPRQTAKEEASRALGHDAGEPEENIFGLGERRIEEYWNTPAHTHFEIVFRFVAEETADLPRGARWFTFEEALRVIKF